MVEAPDAPAAGLETPTAERATRAALAPQPVPTVDLTVHFRAPLPHPTMSDDDFCLVAFRTQVAAEGFVEEDGEVWSPDGILLAHSRQLAALLPE